MRKGEAVENRHVFGNPDFYKRLEHSYDARFFRQEVLGEYLNISQGRVYETFDRERNIRQTELDPRIAALLEPGLQRNAAVLDPGPERMGDVIHVSTRFR